MKAMILAAGEGTRLRAVTGGDIPKPMVDLGEGPLLEHTINHIIDAGVEEIVINLHHRGDVIRDHFGATWRGTPLVYAEEDALLGTAGAVKNVEDRFTEPFLLVYGDVLTDLNLDRFRTFHLEHDAALTMLVYEEDRESLPEASIVLEDEGQVTRMIEKPSPKQVERYADEAWTNAGILCIDPAVIDRIPKCFADWGKDVLPALVAEGQVYAYRLPEDAYWHEVGTPERYEKAVTDVAEGCILFKAGQRNE